MTANQGLHEPTPRHRAPHVARAAQRMLTVLAREKRVLSGVLRDEAKLSTRELRYATKYLRDHGFPVAVTRTGRSSTYWLEPRSEHMKLVVDRYLNDAFESLMMWYRSSDRTGDKAHSRLRGMVWTTCVEIGSRVGKVPEQINMQLMAEFPVDDELEQIWAEEMDRAFAEEIWSNP